jgi:hypothetical protein
MTGPIRLVPNRGRLGGHLERGFIFLFTNILLTMLMKGINLGIGSSSFWFGTTDKNWNAAYWILMNLIPQFLFAFIVLWISIGLWKTLNIISRYPGIIMIATFSCWTIGSPNTTKLSQLFKSTEKIAISPVWMNFIITAGASIFNTLFLMTDSEVFLSQFPEFKCIFITYLPPVIIFIAITLLMGTYTGKYSSSDYCCCFGNCSNTQHTILNVTTMEEDIVIQETMNQSTNTDENTKMDRCFRWFLHCFAFLFVVSILAPLLTTLLFLPSCHTPGVFLPILFACVLSLLVFSLYFRSHFP